MSAVNPVVEVRESETLRNLGIAADSIVGKIITGFEAQNAALRSALNVITGTHYESAGYARGVARGALRDNREPLPPDVTVPPEQRIALDDEERRPPFGTPR